MEYDVVSTPEAKQVWQAVQTGPSPTTRLAISLAPLVGLRADEAERMAGVEGRPGASLEEVRELAWKTAFPGPVTPLDLWHALLCLDLVVRIGLGRIVGEEKARALHREAACTVLGEGMVRWLEVRLRPGAVK